MVYLVELSVKEVVVVYVNLNFILNVKMNMVWLKNVVHIEAKIIKEVVEKRNKKQKRNKRNPKNPENKNKCK